VDLLSAPLLLAELCLEGTSSSSSSSSSDYFFLFGYFLGVAFFTAVVAFPLTCAGFFAGGAFVTGLALEVSVVAGVDFFVEEP